MTSAITEVSGDFSGIGFCRGHDDPKSSRMQSAWRSMFCRSAILPVFTQSRDCTLQVGVKREQIVLDLRNEADFDREHLSGSCSLPIPNFSAGTGGGDLFGNPELLHWASTSLKTLLEGAKGSKILDKARSQDQSVLVLCYHGDFSRLATATLRKRGVTAFSVKGGFGGLRSLTTTKPGLEKEKVGVHLN